MKLLLTSIICVIFYSLSLSADFFWIGSLNGDGNGNWSVAQNWSYTSGGSPLTNGFNPLPGISDNVIFDNNSNIGVNTIINIDIDQVLNFDFSSVSTSFTFNSSLSQLYISGDLRSNGMATFRGYSTDRLPILITFIF